jgi:hypothetical protein
MHVMKLVLLGLDMVWYVLGENEGFIMRRAST